MGQKVDVQTEMPEYHKINSIQKRHENGPLKGQFTGEWVDPVYEYLQDCKWICREKIDGTNIRVHYALADDGFITRIVGGRSNNSSIPAPLYEKLESIFPLNGYDESKVRDIFDESALQAGVTLYGEGFGAGIQKGGNYGPVDFILFDVNVGGWWLDETNTTDNAEKFGVKRVPIYENITTLREAIDLVSTHNLCSNFDNVEVEGIVAVPAVPLFDRRGHRIIVKVKGNDFSKFWKVAS